MNNMASKKFDPDKIIDYNVDYYAILGITKDSLPPSTVENRDTIANILSEAYTRSALKSHPSVDGGSNEAFKLVVRAHTILSDELLRKCYDSGGKDKPRSIEDGALYEIDWDAIGNYRKGTIADTIGFGLFYQISDRSEELGLIPAFYPEYLYHSYEWDWVIKNTDSKLSLAIVPDDEDVLRLTSGNNIKQSLPFKIYICIPRNHLYFSRENNQQTIQADSDTEIIKSKIIRAKYSDYNLKETTVMNDAVEYINNQLLNDLNSFRNGSLVEQQLQYDAEAEQSQWVDTNKIKQHDILLMKAILMSKSFVTQKDPRGADFLEKLKNQP